MAVTEHWKPIEGYEGQYEASDLGNIRSYVKEENGKLLSAKNQYGNYLTVVLTDKNGNRSTKRVHILVAKAFLGEIPKGYHVHHKDGNRQNNTVNNLEIIHPKKHYRETLAMHPDMTSDFAYRAKYEVPRTILMFDLDGNYLASFPSAAMAERITGVCNRNISQVASHAEYSKGKTRKQAGGFVWKYEDESEVTKKCSCV